MHIQCTGSKTLHRDSGSINSRVQKISEIHEPYLERYSSQWKIRPGLRLKILKVMSLKQADTDVDFRNHATAHASGNSNNYRG